MAMTLEKLIEEHEMLNRMRRRVYAKRNLRPAVHFYAGLSLIKLDLSPHGRTPWIINLFTPEEEAQLAAIKQLKHDKVKEINALIKPKGLCIQWGDSGNIQAIVKRDA